MRRWSRSLNRARLRLAQCQCTPYHDTALATSRRAFTTSRLVPAAKQASIESSATNQQSPSSKWLLTKADPSPVRLAMRQLPYPIVLLTTSSGRINHAPLLTAQSNSNVRNYGVILSTFNTVSMGPPAMISFNIKLPSHTWDFLQEQPSFFINFLKATPAAAKLAEAFIQNNHDEAYRKCIQDIPDAGFSWESLVPTASGAPGSEAAAFAVSGPASLASLACTLLSEKCVRVQDHMVCIAQVQGVARLGDEHDEDTGLSYWRGDFGSSGQERFRES